ncbi:MAG: hypothetical protein WC472_00195 [Candidatus Paceibacterota bacterium]
MKKINSERSKEEIYKKDLKILLDIKKSVGLLNNAIHDKSALIAISILEKKYPDFKFSYYGAGVRGNDLVGKRGSKIELVAEIKTTTIESGTTLMSPQLSNIKKDLIRLNSLDIKYKYFIIVSEKVEKEIKRRLDFKTDFKDINILNII